MRRRPTKLFIGCGGSHAPKSVGESVDRLLEHFGGEGLHSAIFGNIPKSLTEDLPMKANGDFKLAFKKHVVAVVLRALRVVEEERARIAKDKRAFTLSDPWRSLRYQVLQKRGARCECCGATAGMGKRIHVDHIKPRAHYPELALEESNLQVLCEDCNIGKGARDETDWRDRAVMAEIVGSDLPDPTN